MAGTSLVESLVALALAVATLAAALPAVVGARALAAATGRRGQMTDAGRLAGHRLSEDLRRAGFGLAGQMDAITVVDSPAGFTVRYLSGGFNGGSALVAPAIAGSEVIQVERLTGLRVGDDAVLMDRRRRSARVEVAGRDSTTGMLTLARPLAQSFLPEDGARVWRLTRRRWWLDNGLLRRDEQPAVDGVRSFAVSGTSSSEAAAVMTWALGGGDLRLPSAASVMALRLVLAGRSRGEMQPGPALPDYAVPVLIRPANQGMAQQAGSGMP